LRKNLDFASPAQSAGGERNFKKMNLLKNYQTNLKYILIVTILAVIVGGGILGYYRWIKEEIKMPEVETPEPEAKAPEEEIIPEKIIVDLEKFNTIEDAIVYYLNQYPTDPNVLQKIFIKNGLEENMIKWVEKYDLDSDGIEEIILGLGSKQKEYIWPAWYIISKKGSKYEIVYEGTTPSGSVPYESPEFKFIRDINQDDRLEVVVTSLDCGAHTCFLSVEAVQWTEKEWRNLTPQISISSSDELKFEDRDGDGTEEIVIHGGTIASAGAGMQRQYTQIYTYQIYTYREGEYHLIKTIGDPSTNIYYLMLDANKALKENNLTDALKLATQALQNPNSGVSSDEYGDEYGYVNERDQVRILSYVAIEAMLVYLKQSPPDLNSVNSLLQEITQKYNKFDNPYINASQILRDTYLTTGDIQKACQAMENEILKAGDNAEFLHWYGYNTEKLDLKNLCP